MLRFCRPPPSPSFPVAPIEQVAAAVAVGLYLQGIQPVSIEELAASAAVALHLSTSQPRPRRHPERFAASGWAISGRMHHMGVRPERGRLRAIA